MRTSTAVRGKRSEASMWLLNLVAAGLLLLLGAAPARCEEAADPLYAPNAADVGAVPSQKQWGATKEAPDKTGWPDPDGTGVGYEVFSERLKKRLDHTLPKMTHLEVFDAVRTA